MALSALANIPTIGSFLAQLDTTTSQDGLTSEVFRESNQSQRVSQGSRAFSGAQVGNTATDEARITQNASAVNSQNITITPSDGSVPDVGFAGPRNSRVFLGSPQSTGALGQLQDQAIDQSAFASLTDANGSRSRAGNSATLNEDANTQLDVRNNINLDAQTNFLGDQPSATLIVSGSDLPGGRQGNLTPGGGSGTAPTFFNPANFLRPALPSLSPLFAAITTQAPQEEEEEIASTPQPESQNPISSLPGLSTGLIRPLQVAPLTSALPTDFQFRTLLPSLGLDFLI